MQGEHLHAVAHDDESRTQLTSRRGAATSNRRCTLTRTAPNRRQKQNGAALKLDSTSIRPPPASTECMCKFESTGATSLRPSGCRSNP